ncbi:zinc-finger homeodomain protein 4-like [Mangifera indica]|uniref:zinc-finger homeodomain protein 4-like n=1 Tax=Mangifera indica TaxID=29780 RepID=UPI001CFAAF95|nr:zinc-finger homeodomain protein 4-like [Mangifera indica]
MGLSSHEEEDIPVPLNSTYVHGHGHPHMIHHDHLHHHYHHHGHITPSSTLPLPSSTNNNGSVSSPMEDPHLPTTFKKMTRYRECLKNHAAAMGGTATDGCGEFMPSGEEGTMEALNCSVCNCHRNFHRKEIEGEIPNHPPLCDCLHNLNTGGRKLILGHHHHLNLLPPEGLGLISSRPQQMIMSYNMGLLPSESDDQEEARLTQTVKKRHRTKFSQDQKEKMVNFAEKVGWKIQKQEESIVQQFCQEIGVKRRVLKVWMHNNKHNLAKKKNSNNINHHPEALTSSG